MKNKAKAFLKFSTALFALSVGVQSATAGATQVAEDKSPAISVTFLLPTDQKPNLDNNVILAHDSWNFVHCVASSHDCEHHAHNEGYHHHRVVRDHHTCEDEPHLACYGR